MPNFHSARPLILLILIPVLLFTGCGSSGSNPDEPPVYSPLQVLVPEAPGKKTLGTSPLVLDISDTDQGYLTAVSDSTDQMMNVQLTAEDGVVYSYFISPGESAVIPFSSGSLRLRVSIRCNDSVCTRGALTRSAATSRSAIPSMQHFMLIPWK